MAIFLVLIRFTLNIIGKARDNCHFLNRQITIYSVNNTSEADRICEKHNENMLVLSESNKNDVIKFITQCMKNFKKPMLVRAKNNLSKLNKNNTKEKAYFLFSFFKTFKILKIKFANLTLCCVSALSNNPVQLKELSLELKLLS